MAQLAPALLLGGAALLLMLARVLILLLGPTRPLRAAGPSRRTMIVLGSGERETVRLRCQPEAGKRPARMLF